MLVRVQAGEPPRPRHRLDVLTLRDSAAGRLLSSSTSRSGVMTTIDEIVEQEDRLASAKRTLDLDAID
jgi:hypothetical protein